ncbi:MAG: TonB-dependent receptor [Pseudomonadota bacterium]
MIRPKCNSKLLTTAALVLPAASATALAQTEDTDFFGVEEITVTARKRVEPLQKTPIAITAFSAQGLEQRQIQQISGIGQFTPSLTFETAAPISGNSAVAVMFIRGIGQVESIPTVDLGVGLYVDGVYLARSVGGVVDLLDVERVEVLRGPQGTLFGRNTIGGAISITTKKPGPDFSGQASILYGTDNRVLPTATVNVPLSDTLFFKASAAYEYQEGYVERPDGLKTGDEDRLSGRAHLRWLANEKLEMNLVFDVTRERTNGAPYVLVETNADGFYAANPDGSPTAFPNSERSALFPFFHNIVFNAPICAGGPPPVVMPPDDPRCYGSHFIPENQDQDFSNKDVRSDLDIFGVSFTTDYDFGSTQLKSITSYRQVDSVYSLDQDHSPLPIAEVDTENDQWQFTQEVQLVGEALDGRLNWVGGIFYFKEEATALEQVLFPVVNIQSGGAIDNDSIAGFAQGTFEITEQLSMTAGIRYTRDTKRFTPDQFVITSAIGLPPGTPLLPAGEISQTFSNWTPMINLAYQWTPDLMTYFTFSEGFKSGGFTQRIFPPLPEVPTFQPETARVFEAGFKSQVLDDRVRLNAALFRTDYEDVQVTVQNISVAPIILNAAKAEIWGGEVELLAQLTPEWTIEAGLGYINAEYTETGEGSQVTTANDLLKTPEWTLTAGSAYRVAITSDWSLTPRVDWSYRSRQENNAINSPAISQPGYHLVDLGLILENEETGWQVLGRVSNLTDERFITAGYSDQNNPQNVALGVEAIRNLGISEAVFDRGRQFSIQVRKRF